MNKKITMISIVVGITLIIMSVTVMAQEQQATNKEYNLKLIFEDKLVFNENIAENKEIVVKFVENNSTLENIKITEDIKITLDSFDVPNRKIISYWKRETQGNQEVISPVLIDEKDFNITYYAGVGTMLKDKNIVTPTLTKSVENGENLSDIMPEVQTEENINFVGWHTIEEKEIEVETKEKSKEKSKDKKKSKDKEENKDDEDEKDNEKKTEIIQEYKELNYPSTREVSEDMEIYAISFPDMNENNKDDRKEEINLKVNFIINDEVVEKKLHVGQRINLATPINDDHIFLGWYLDPDFQEEYTGEALERDTTIYAKWKTPQDYIKSRELIDDEMVSERVEEFLYEENQQIYTDSKKSDEQKAKAREQEKEENTFNMNDKRYVFKNYNKEQTYFVKFYNDEEFLFSVALPYGNTVELLNEKEQKVKEYSVRQNVSIRLDSLISVSEIPKFKAKTIKRNNANILQIYPKNNKELSE